ncbi:16S rRNA (uracil(1498)-N(3))-methyltransferase [Methylobacillus flagellatus]|uniref:Ribosomal RNA small subunit methyltransferase E n=1 Tax=Methylobacillus flagellatus (strain ATCC 51484 / DSM 6875 / VKM B-1610 / KT) TaxID=265072 RepID=Q1GZ19_METFK|nr:16S rRNA (uracil(1498)-N(3))-methyltransferase [Methylobacillus flagellatus]ABE50518.1 16S rRNA m(3)U-1498 methyltransferase [Methylobacillus flagellatus KT]
MTTPRFYHPGALIPGNETALAGNAASHASKALRMQVGDHAILFNGDGHNYLSRLTSIRKQEVIAEVLEAQPCPTESPLKITLAQAISSGDRMDFTIQKAVEMGVSSIQPIFSQRSIVKLTGERAEKRREHWQNVAISACEQSGRAYIPPVAPAINLSEWLAQKPGADAYITLAPGAPLTLPQLTSPTRHICLLIGPEGGLADHEIALAAQHGFTLVRMGPRILRTETAAIAAIASMQTLWGDFIN